MTDPERLIHAYLDDDIDAESFAELCRWLESDPSHVQTLVRAQAQHADTSDWVNMKVGEALSTAGPFGPDQSMEAFIELLASLDDHEGQSEVVELIGEIKTKQHGQQSLRLPVSQPWLWGSLAAVLAVALVLIVVFRGGTESVPVAVDPSQTIEPSPLGLIVATLTAERDALWDRRPGEDLYSGQRFTLTEGFAEITTNRGAVAILEAPATIELIDNNNAIRLHTGKLVGVCETESSKGFLVRTAYMDITDVGTRFGVDTDAQSTSVSVFEGEVEVTRYADQAGPQTTQRLVAGRSLLGSETGLVDLLYEPQAFNKVLGIDELRPQTEGGPVVWKGMLPHDMRSDQQEADAVQVFLERRAVVLEADTPVDMTPGESWPPERGFGKASVLSGTAVDVYLLHMDRTINTHNIRTRSIRCVIRFDRPIVGVIAAESTLRQTDAGLSLPGALHPTVVDPENAANPAGGLAGLEFDTKYADTAIVSDDGMSLELELHAPIAVDQVRILVRSRQK